MSVFTVQMTPCVSLMYQISNASDKTFSLALEHAALAWCVLRKRLDCKYIMYIIEYYI